jgi:predicted DsbA family dithiol-disulfide isomerase
VWWPSSLKAHQLLRLAQERGLGRRAKELLLLCTYERGLNISEVGTLVAAAQELGMEGEEVRRYLQQDQGLQAVLREDAEAKQQLRISGVPYFLVGPAGEAAGEPRRYALSGAQPAAAFERVVGKLLEELRQQQPTA